MKHFEELSNFKINYSKSHALNISLTPQEVAHTQASFPFQWEKNAITYLGIQITKRTDLYNHNFLNALSKLQTNINEWTNLNKSWFGRAAPIKMVVLPRLLYLMQAIPIHLPPSFFSTYKKMCTAFLWKNKPPCIKYMQMTHPKPKGGIGLPDLYKYHLACHLTRIVDWQIHFLEKAWVIIERCFMHTSTLTLPWLLTRWWPQSLKEHPFI